MNTSTESTKQKIINILVTEFGVEEDEITEDSSFIYDFGLDSLDIIEVIMFLEEDFGIYIEDHEFVNIHEEDFTLAWCINKVEEHTNG